MNVKIQVDRGSKVLEQLARQARSMLLKFVDRKTNHSLKVSVSSDESGKKSVGVYQYSGRRSSVRRFRLEETGGEEGGEDTER